MPSQNIKNIVSDSAAVLSDVNPTFVNACEDIITYLGGELPTAPQLFQSTSSFSCLADAYQLRLAGEVILLTPNLKVEADVNFSASSLVVNNELITCLDDFIKVKQYHEDTIQEECPSCGGDGCADCEDPDDHYYPWGDDFYE
jgi:hypothetical protein